MKLLILIPFFFLSSFLFACNYTVYLHDTYHNGWNGNSMTVYVNGVPVLSEITINVGSDAQFYFTANTDDMVSISYYETGGWGDQNEITINSSDLGSVVFTDGTGGEKPFGGSFTVAADCGIAPPANDEPCQAIHLPMSGTCNPTFSSNNEATATAIAAPICGTYNANSDVWFETTVGPSGHIQISLTEGSVDANIAIYGGIDCNNLNEIDCSLSNTFYSNFIPTGAQIWIRVCGENANTGSFNICAFEPPPPPPNNEPCTAEPLTVNTSCTLTTGTTVDAIKSTIAKPSCISGDFQDPDVWYAALVTTTGLRISISADDVTDGGLAIYTGADCNSLTEIACNMNAWQLPGYLMVSPTFSGQTVWIRVWEHNNDSPGTFGICAIEPPPPPTNNEPCIAELLTVNSICTNTIGTTLSSIDSDVAAPSCAPNYQGGDVWFTATVPTSGFLHVNLSSGGLIDGGIGIYSGADCATLTEIACTEDTSAMPETLVISPAYALQDQQVWIRIWEGNNDNPGSFQVCLTNDTVLFVDTASFTIPQLVEEVLVSNCTQVSNIQFHGDTTAIAYFGGGLNAFSMHSGIVLSSGTAAVLTEQAEQVVMVQDTIITAIEADLSAISVLNGGSPDINDELILEFDFIANSNTIEFDFVFASVEYPNYEFSSYNDVIAVFVSGPGIVGPFSDSAINVALVPGTTEPISISSINGTTHSNFFGGYTAENPIPNFKVGGYTLPLKSIIDSLIPYETYHIKFAIADAADGSLNSYFSLKERSFSAGVETQITSQASSQNITEIEDVAFTITATGLNLTYQWLKNGLEINNDENRTGCTTSELTISNTSNADAGIYNCTVTGDCGTVTSDDATLSSSVGVPTYLKTNISIYPNPAQQSFIIKGINGAANYKIYNLQGDLIQTGSISDRAISILDYPKGVYIIEIISVEQNQKLKFIKS